VFPLDLGRVVLFPLHDTDLGHFSLCPAVKCCASLFRPSPHPGPLRSPLLPHPAQLHLPPSCFLLFRFWTMWCASSTPCTSCSSSPSFHFSLRASPGRRPLPARRPPGGTTSPASSSSRPCCSAPSSCSPRRPQRCSLRSSLSGLRAPPLLRSRSPASSLSGTPPCMLTTSKKRKKEKKSPRQFPSPGLSLGLLPWVRPGCYTGRLPPCPCPALGSFLSGLPWPSQLFQLSKHLPVCVRGCSYEAGASTASRFQTGMACPASWVWRRGHSYGAHVQRALALRQVVIRGFRV